MGRPILRKSVQSVRKNPTNTNRLHAVNTLDFLKNG